MMCRLQRSNNSQTGSALGNVITLLLLLALVGIGVYMVVNKKGSAPASEQTQSTAAPKPAAGEADMRQERQCDDDEYGHGLDCGYSLRMRRL